MVMWIHIIQQVRIKKNSPKIAPIVALLNHKLPFIFFNA